MGEIRRYRRQYLSGCSLVVVDDESLLIDAVGVKSLGRTDLVSVFFDNESLWIGAVGIEVLGTTDFVSVFVNDDCCWGFIDDIGGIPPIIDTPLLVVTSSNWGLFSRITVDLSICSLAAKIYI